MFAIEINDLTKIYERHHLGRTFRSRGIEDVSLAIKPGEVFGLLGLNGSGKTTTIKLILGLLRPTTGTIAINGTAMPDTEMLRRVGYLPEVPYFYRYLTAREILMLYARLSNLKNPAERVATVIESVGLTDWADKRLTEFSKGMLQRIGLAQSLVHDPDILVYDEPVSGLDPLAMQEMRNLILSLKGKGKTIFLSSHLISEVEKLCDRVAILAQGRLVRVMDESAWAGKPGELERVFVGDVAGTSAMGRIKI